MEAPGSQKRNRPARDRLPNGLEKIYRNHRNQEFGDDS